MILQVEISDESYPLLLDSLCLLGNYKAEIDDGSGLNVMISNPISREDFCIGEAKKMLVEKIRLAQTVQEQTSIIL